MSAVVDPQPADLLENVTLVFKNLRVSMPPSRYLFTYYFKFFVLSHFQFCFILFVFLLS